MRREFSLPEGDSEFLDAGGFLWETVNSGGNWVLIHEFPIPPGYNTEKSSIALRIDAGYPIAQIDMVYFFPALQRSDGRPINALSGHAMDGKQWQRWSRHRTPANPWRPEVDDISTHISLVQHWLEREFQIR